jgi:Integrase core domain
MDIRDRPISPRSPWQNGYSERLIGSIRWDCLDHVVVFGERHLRHLLNSYQKYYNEARTHLSLQCPQITRYSSEIGKRRFASDRAVKLPGLFEVPRQAESQGWTPNIHAGCCLSVLCNFMS